MPRGRTNAQPTIKSEEARLLWNQTGQRYEPTVDHWDPKPEPLLNALLEILATGCTLCIRPGSGNRSIGIAIWEKDYKHDPKWFYDNEEIDDWAQDINEQAKSRREKQEKG